MSYKVLTSTLGGWEDCWGSEEDSFGGTEESRTSRVPTRFATREEAEEEIQDLLQCCEDAGVEGYSRDDYDIVECTTEAE